MINIWEYGIGDKVRILSSSNMIFIGRIESITDAEERSDLDIQEDGIYIITDAGRHIEIYQSEIKEISKTAAKEIGVSIGEQFA